MELSRRDFLNTASLAGLSLWTYSFESAAGASNERLKLDKEFINQVKNKIEREILPLMEKIYLNNGTTFNDDYAPGLKYLEKIVNFYDYQACGISVLAILALQGNDRAKFLIKRVLDNSLYYSENIYGNDVGGSKWDTPLRRLLLHLAIAYKTLESILSEEEKKVFRHLIEQQVPLAIKWNKDFFPGKGDLYMNTNNHTAIFMQGIYYCGKIFNHPEWVDITNDFARRVNYPNSG